MARKSWTIGELKKLEELATSGKCIREIAEELGRSYSSVKNKLYFLNIETIKESKYNQKVFAWYKGDQQIAEGTIFELSEMFGVSVKTVRYYLSKRHESFDWENGIKLVEVD